jgi:Ala-tRNA(Pro) deacylase
MLVPQENKQQLVHKGAVCDYLNAAKVNYTIVEQIPDQPLAEISSYVGIAAHKLIQVQILQDEKGLLMVILPEDCLFDIGILCKHINRELEPANHELLDQFFGNCELGAFPPLPDLFDIPAIMDESLDDVEQIYFKPGVNDALVSIKRSEFMKFHVQTWREQFTIPVRDLANTPRPEGGVT